MLTISIKQPGSLKEQLEEGEWKKIKGIKITGTINEEDIEWLKVLTAINKGLYYIDLIEVANNENIDFPLLFERGVSNLSLPEGLKKIGKNTLRCLSANTINIPKSILSIEKGAFNSSQDLKIINVHEQNLKYKSINGLLYTKDGHELIFCPPKREGAITIQEGTKKISPKAFQGCEKLRLVILPQSIDKENTGTLIKDFTNKKTEVRWTIDQDRFDLGETHYSMGGRILERHSPDPEDYKEGDPHYDLYKKAEYDFYVPNNVEEIQENAFENCFQLKDIKLPNSLYAIKAQAFANCTHINAIELPSKLKLVEAGCFNGCRSLGKICSWATTPPKCTGEIIDFTQDKMLYVPKGSLNSYKKAKGWKSFKNIREVESLTTIVIRMCNGEKNTITYSPSITKSEIKDYTNNIWQSIGKITITGRISDNDIAFLREMCINGKLTDIDITDSNVLGLPKKAFADAENLVSINLPNSLSTIPDSCFLNCKKLRKISIGANTELIEPFAFAECTNLKNISFDMQTKLIGRGAYWNCKSLENIIINGTELTISEDAFRGCEFIKRIDIHCPTPPKCCHDTFPQSIYSNSEITFPSSGYNSYMNDTVWNKFTKKIAENILF